MCSKFKQFSRPWDDGSNSLVGQTAETQTPETASQATLTTCTLPVARLQPPENGQVPSSAAEDGQQGKEKVIRPLPTPYQTCRHWRVQIGLLILSVCSLVAITVLLATEYGISLEHWTFYSSLNTIVSVLGTISRASLATAVASCLAQEKWNWFLNREDHLLMFDRLEGASRGSIGSLKLLFC